MIILPGKIKNTVIVLLLYKVVKFLTTICRLQICMRKVIYFIHFFLCWFYCLFLCNTFGIFFSWNNLMCRLFFKEIIFAMSILDVGVISRDDTLGLVDTMGNLPGSVIRNILILSVDVRVGCFHVIKGSAFFMIIA